MGGEDDLGIRVELPYQVDETLLPVDVERDFGFIHQQGIWFSVLHQYGQQDGKHLLLTAGELVGCNHLGGSVTVCLHKLDFVALPVNLLVCVGKQFVNHVLKLLFGRTHLRSLHLVVGVSAGQQFDDTVADIHLIVEEPLLQTVDLPIQFFC